MEQVKKAFAEASRPQEPKRQAKDYVQLFSKRLMELDRSKTPYETFRDFCELAYCAYTKKMASTQEAADALEDRYMRVVGTYRDKDIVRQFPEMLSWVHLGLMEGQEFLGAVASQLEFLDTRNSQFFTPPEISRLMAEMILGNPDHTIEANGYLTMQEPASGAGGMILAAANVLEARGYDAGRHMLVHATDIAEICYYMTYLQCTMRGIPARVVWGNTLSLEVFEAAWTPITRHFYGIHGRLFDRPEDAAAEPERDQAAAKEPAAADDSDPPRPMPVILPVHPGQTQQLRLF